MRRFGDWDREQSKKTFQFTHPGRGATEHTTLLLTGDSRFNSRTPGGVRQLLDFAVYVVDLFQFTHPGRGATPLIIHLVRAQEVSIHAPREGCDLYDLL